MIGRMLRAFATQFRSAYREQELRDKFPHLRLSEGVVVRGLSRFTVGRNTLLDRRAYLNCAGGGWNGHRGHITIGENCEIGPYAVLWGAGGITIGDNVHIGAHVSITAHEARQIEPDSLDVWKPLDFDFAPVVIEDHTLVCSGSVIVPGVTIGHHSMIGAGAVVVSDIPPYSLAVGCPARVLRSLRPLEAASQSA
jgi:acetyltransferase-like isoleucine patch superfamily enzyme